MRIALLTTGGRWLSGPIYFKNLFRVLRQCCKQNVERFLVSGGSYLSRIQDYEGEIDGEIKLPRGPHGQAVRGVWAERIFSDASAESRLFKKHGINLVLGQELVNSYSGIGTLSWVLDFQPRRLPQLFSPVERRMRDNIVCESMRNASRIVVISESVRNDFVEFFPEDVSKVRTLRYATLLPENVYQRNAEDVARSYALPERFIYLPNQFYRHKNHLLVFKALRVLKNKGLRINVVCSGLQEDYRFPKHYQQLMEKAVLWVLPTVSRVLARSLMRMCCS